jgi:hypothetical protein
VLLGDPQQLHAVGRGGMFDELCANNRVHELTHIHRFSERWEPSASLALRRGDPAAIGNYVLHDRVAAGTIDDHLATIADRWMTATASSQTIAITATNNEHVDLINRGIQRRRVALGDIALDEPTIGMGMDRYAADRTVKRLARRAGINKRISPHSLRHSFITAALDAGVPLRDVQEAASHADPRTTIRYDRARQSLDRHATYIVAAFIAGASRTT